MPIEGADLVSRTGDRFLFEAAKPATMILLHEHCRDSARRKHLVLPKIRQMAEKAAFSGGPIRRR